MKTFYCVVSMFFDDGGVKAFLYSVVTKEKPKNVQVEDVRCDKYRDYFDTYDEAEDFRKSCYAA